MEATGHSTADRDGGDFFNYAGLFRVREGELGLGACLVVGEQRHRWGGGGVQRQAGSTCAGAAVAGRWNGMDACAMRRISTAGARADPAVRGDVSGTPAGGAGWFGLAWLSCVGAVEVGGGRWRHRAGGRRWGRPAVTGGSVRRSWTTWDLGGRRSDAPILAQRLPAADVPTITRSNAHS